MFHILIGIFVPLQLLIGSIGIVDGIQQSPNIVFILADDLGFDDVSFRGNREFLTPNIDALAYHGKILDNYYTPTWDMASKATVMTGRYPIHNGMPTVEADTGNPNDKQWVLDRNIKTFAEIFEEIGYNTQLLGKWHLGFSDVVYTPTYRGFRYHYGFWNDYIDYYTRRHVDPHTNFTGYDFYASLGKQCEASGKYVTDLLTDEAERLIEKHQKEKKPFLLMIHHLAVNRGNPEQPLPVPAEELDKFRYIQNPARRKYAAMLTKLDESVGRVLSALDRAELLNNTIVIFSADNSAPTVGKLANGGSNYPLKGEKNTPWEGGVRVPAAVWSAQMQQRHSIYKPVFYAGDWLPTLSAADNLYLPSRNLNLDGINQWPQLLSARNWSAAEQSEREIVHVLNANATLVSIMRGQWKYVRGTTRNGTADNTLVLREFEDLHPDAAAYTRIVATSLASQALAKYDDPAAPLTTARMAQLCRKAHVRCGDVQRGCNALIEECLYDLHTDPCEQNNLAYSKQHADLLATMRSRAALHARNAWFDDQILSINKNRYDPGKFNCLWTYYNRPALSEVYHDCHQATGLPCDVQCNRNACLNTNKQTNT